MRSRIEAGCAAAGRSGDEITLVAVTKFFPVTDVALLAELGVTDVGESRDQDASVKAAQLAEEHPWLRWHFIGRLQTNKARSVARYADLVHSVDRPGLADALADGARRAERSALDVLVQLNLDDPADDIPAGRGGGSGLGPAAAGRRGRGLRRVPAGRDHGHRPARRRSRTGRSSGWPRWPGGCVPTTRRRRMVSAGMSDDLEAALRHGATHVRIGTALLGRRAPQFG